MRPPRGPRLAAGASLPRRGGGERVSFFSCRRTGAQQPPPPLTDAPSLDLALAAARQKARCDYGLFLGAGGDNLERASALAGQCCGLKLYLDQTFGPLKLDGLDQVTEHPQRWPGAR